MKKFFKTLFIMVGTALAGYFGFKLYKKITSITKLHKSLPEFLCNVYGEKPALHINHNLKTTTIKVGFTQEILDKHTDIENTVREYVDDFYPDLAKSPLIVEIFAKTAETEEDSCCSGNSTEKPDED